MTKILSGLRSFFGKSVTFEQAVQLWTRGVDSASSQSITEAYRQSTWVHSAIKAVTAPIKGVSVRFYANDLDLDENNAVVAWWQNPAVNMTLSEFVESTGGWQKLAGESFWLLDDTWFESRADKNKLIMARPLDMRHIIQGGQLAGWVYTDAAGTQHNLLPEEVIHMKQWNPYNPWRGLGELDAARIAVETDYAAGKYARDTFRNAGDAGAYVTSKSGMPSEAQQTQIVAALREKRAARLRGDYRPVFLAGDIAVTDPQVQAPDAAFVSNRQLSRHEIFIAFGVPASMSDVIASYSIGSASDMFRLISNTCIPLSDSIAATINRVLLMQYGNNPLVRCYFDWDEHPTMQAVRRERIDAAVKLWNMGMPMDKVNDYLDMELPEFSGWNRSYLPMNLMSNEPQEIEDDQPEINETPEIADVVEDMSAAFAQRKLESKATPNLRPTAEMASEAALGLKWREEYGRGGTPVGVARARDIKNRSELSPDTIGRMVSFFARHGSNRSEHYDGKENDGGPTAWRIAWQLWGGDAGRDWSENKWAQINDDEEKDAPETTRAINDNIEQRAMLWNQLTRTRSAAEKAYQNKFTRVLIDARREQIAKIEAHGSMFGSGQKALSEALVFSLNPFKNKLKAAYRQVTTAVLPEAVEQANNELKPIAPKPSAGAPSAEVSPWKMPPEKAIRFIEQRENVMAGIADDVHKQIMGIIEEAMQQQLGATQTANLIRAKFNEISNGRAKTIARTETGAAYGFSREAAMQAAGIQYKEWLSTPDDRCRETHRAADGQVVGIDETFQVGGAALMFPCDPAGPPEEIINCRCVQIAVSQP